MEGGNENNARSNYFPLPPLHCLNGCKYLGFTWVQNPERKKAQPISDRLGFFFCFLFSYLTIKKKNAQHPDPLS